MNAVVNHAEITKVEKDMGDLFACKGNRSPKGLMISVRDDKHAYVPRLTNYLFDPDLLKTLLLWVQGIVNSNIYFGGPAGCGKSSIIEQFAARLGIPVFRMGCHRGVKMEDLRGQFILKVKDGIQVMEFVEGPLVQAMKAGGILLLDEGDSLDPTTLLGLNTILDSAPYLVPETDELVVPHPEFRVAMTGNTMGAGDDSGLMKGTTRQSLAVMDRFSLVKADYMEWVDEALVLNGALPNLPGKVVEQLLMLAKDVRLAMKGEGEDKCEIPLSTRGLIRTGQYVTAFMKKDVPMDDETMVMCLDRAFLARANPVDRKFVLTTAQHVGLTSKVMS